MKNFVVVNVVVKNSPFKLRGLSKKYYILSFLICIFLIFASCAFAEGYSNDGKMSGDMNLNISSDTAKPEIPDGFVVLNNFIPDLVCEIRYYSDYNFVGERIDGYEAPCAILTIEAAEALKAVNEDLIANHGYCLKIYDAYRPQRAVDHFIKWQKNLKDTKMKNDFYPETKKSELFKRGYLARKSGHSRGSTVDLTLFDVKNKTDVDMGGTFDYFGLRSHYEYKNLTSEQRKNRKILRDAMTAHNFKPISNEWWHFTLKNEPYPKTYFNFPVMNYESK